MKNKNGATSIFLILLMLVLMVLGLTVLTTTLSSQRLSEKKQAWTQTYYDLESTAAEVLADIDEQLSVLKYGSKDEAAYIDMISHQYDVFGDDTLNMYIIVDNGGIQYISITLALVTDLNSVRNYHLIGYQQLQDSFDYEDIEFGIPFIPDE